MMLQCFLVYLALLSLVTLIVYGVDKARAKRGLWRISERALLTLSIAGGAVGGLAAMQLFRHKTKHLYFYAVNILSILLHAGIVYLLYRSAV